MGRIILGLFLGFAAVFLGVYWVRTCLPNPYEEEIEWVERPNAIVVQAASSGGKCPFCSVTMPEFTLYGDGTLIFATRSEGEWQYFKGQLSRAEVQDVLEAFDDTGFFSFDYTLRPEIMVEDGRTTFVYASTRETANAVAADELGVDPLGGDSDERHALEDLVKTLDGVELASEATPLVPDGGILTTERITSTVPINSTPWPFDVDITSTERQATKQLSRDELQLLGATDLSRVHTWLLVEQDNEVYRVRYRPALPYEENFPEFDTPS